MEYETLRRELTDKSRRSLSKAEEGESEEFNLDQFLHGMSREREENGHKRKHLGVSWTNLHVEVNKKKKNFFLYTSP